MKIKHLTFLLFLIVISCSFKKTIKQNTEQITEITNYSISGLQEDKLRQANEAFYRGNFYSAINIYKSLLDSFMAIDNQDAIINLLLIISDTYIEALNYQKAVETIEITKNRIETIFYKNPKKYRYIALYLTTLAKLLLNYDDKTFKDMREGIVKHSFILSKNTNDPNILMKAYINLGYLYFSQKDIESALENFKKALYIANYTGKKYSYATICEMIGKIYSEKEDFGNAKQFFITAYQIFSKNNYLLPLGKIMISIADSLVKENDINSATSFYVRALENINSNDDIDKDIKEYYVKLITNRINNLKLKLPIIRIN